MIEKVTGKTWDEAMRERLFTPLGLTHTMTLPEEALLYAAAVGHVTAGRRASHRAGLAAAALDRPGRPGHRRPSPTCWPSRGCT